MARSMGRTDGQVITNSIVIVDIVFRVSIADCTITVRRTDNTQTIRSSTLSTCFWRGV
jgi:hypothetical protein